LSLVSVQPVVAGVSQLQLQVPPGLAPGLNLHFQTLRSMLLPNGLSVPIISAADNFRLL
jgi:hypothetical protein